MGPNEVSQLIIPDGALFLPYGLISNHVTDNGPPKLKADIEAWCQSTLTSGSYQTEWTLAKFKPDSELARLFANNTFTLTTGESTEIAINITIPLIRFTDERDMVMFKLRWGDTT